MRTYYMWKEMAMDDDGNLFPIDPHHDPMQYEFPINFIFDSLSEAETWLRDDADDWGVSPEETNDWVLVMYNETIMPREVNQ